MSLYDLIEDLYKNCRFGVVTLGGLPAVEKDLPRDILQNVEREPAFTLDAVILSK